MKPKYLLVDTVNKPIKYFNSYIEANNFRIVKERPDWLIVEYYPIRKQSTPKQISAVRFCEHMLDISFNGNIHNIADCSEFLSKWLDRAKELYTELKCEYEADRGY